MTVITNMDAWDRRSFLESMEQDQRLKDADIEGTRRQANYTEFMSDVFGSLYKYKPEQRLEKDITPDTSWMDAIYNEIKQLPEWDKLRERTKLNDVASAAATAEFCLRFNSAVPQQPNKNKVTPMEKIMEKREGRVNTPKNAQFDGNTKIEDIDTSAVRRAAREACEAAAEEVDKINEAMNAIGYGTEAGRRQTIAPSLKKKMAGRLFNNEQIRKIAELAGRMQRIAINKQKSKTKHGIDEITSITIGDDIGRLIPSEMVKLNHPLLKLDFQKRLLEKSLAQYQLSGYDQEGRGPLIICCDESGSMAGKKDVWSKAVALALLRIAQKQKRTFAMIHYDSRVHRIDKFDKCADPIEIMDAITHFTGGGTNFEHPLNEAFQIISKEKNYEKADLIFICDGQAQLSDEFLKIFNDGKQRAGFQVISVLIDHNDDTVCKQFSDQIVHVNGSGNDDEDALNIMFDI